MLCNNQKVRAKLITYKTEKNKTYKSLSQHGCISSAFESRYIAALPTFDASLAPTLFFKKRMMIRNVF